MTDQPLLRKEIKSLIQNQLPAVLSTLQDGQPYDSLVAFTANEDLSKIYFATSRSSRKFINMVQDNRIALLIDNRSNQQEDFQSAPAITVIGSVQESEGEDRDKTEKLHLFRHPYFEEFFRAPSTTLMYVHVLRHIMVTHFQEVFVPDMPH